MTIICLRCIRHLVNRSTDRHLPRCQLHQPETSPSRVNGLCLACCTLCCGTIALFGAPAEHVSLLFAVANFLKGYRPSAMVRVSNRAGDDVRLEPLKRSTRVSLRSCMTASSPIPVLDAQSEPWCNQQSTQPLGSSTHMFQQMQHSHHHQSGRNSQMA